MPGKQENIKVFSMCNKINWRCQNWTRQKSLIKKLMSTQNLLKQRSIGNFFVSVSCLEHLSFNFLVQKPILGTYAYGLSEKKLAWSNFKFVIISIWYYFNWKNFFLLKNLKFLPINFQRPEKISSFINNDMLISISFNFSMQFWKNIWFWKVWNATHCYTKLLIAYRLLNHVTLS